MRTHEKVKWRRQTQLLPTDEYVELVLSLDGNKQAIAAAIAKQPKKARSKAMHKGETQGTGGTRTRLHSTPTQS